MPDDTTLVAYLTPKLTNQVENAATDALGFILNKSAPAREALNDLLGEGGFDMPPIVRVDTQVAYEDGSRPDMGGYDENGVKRLLVESKFWASLLPGQASGYLSQLDGCEPAALLFIAPGVRFETLWTEIVRQIGGDKIRPESSANGRRSAMVVGVQKRLILASWDRLLRSMADRAGDESALSDIRQLQGLARRQNDEAFLPIRGDELSPEFARRAVGYSNLVNDAVDRGISQNWMTTRRDGSTVQRTPRWYGYGRFFYFIGVEGDFWFGINIDMWARSGDTPLWLWHRSNRNRDGWKLSAGGEYWFPIRLKPGVEYPEVLDDVASQLKEIAKTFGANPPDHSRVHPFF